LHRNRVIEAVSSIFAGFARCLARLQKARAGGLRMACADVFAADPQRM